MNKKTVLIVEDQIESAAMLKKMLKEINPAIECIEVTTKKEAFGILCEKRIDVFLIDIILDVNVEDDVSGLKLAEEIRGIEKYKFAPIIFITALEDPQLYAYRTLHSYAYIQKPFLVERTKKTLEEALCYTTKQQKPQTFLFRVDGMLFPIDEDIIAYIESKDHMLYVYEREDELHVPYKTLNDMIKDIEGDNFLQCNRNTLVNKKYIVSVDPVEKNINLKDNKGKKSLPIGRKYFEKVLKGIENVD